jgi:outer membrane lipoprotein
MRATVLTVIVALVSACTTVPEQIQGPYTQVSPARVDPAVFGTEVRWGGIILNAKNKNEHTCFEILSRDLDKHLRPEREDFTAGRFIACKSGFHDPEVFTRGREVTLTGRIRNIEERELDGFSYRYPVLDVDNLVLWKKRQTVMVVDHASPYWGYPYGAWGYPYGAWGYPYGGWGYPYRYGWPMHSRSRISTRELLPDPSIIETEPEN